MRWRWLALAVASVALHLLAIEYANGELHWPTRPGSPEATMTALLHAAPVPTRPPARPAPVATPRRPVPARPVQRPVATPDPTPTPTPPPTGFEAPGTSIESAPTLVPTESPSVKPPPVARSTQEDYQVNPPPSVELKYDVTKVPRDGQPIYGHGKIHWQSQGNRYLIAGEASVLFFTALTFRSEGMLDEFGIAPVIYNEKRFRRPETNTHFQRERNIISFSASETQYPRRGGEQDRASIIWQLAAIGRGDRHVFVPNARIDVFVAGVRDGETWQIQILGQEDIDLGAGKFHTWHLTRIPRPGSYEQKLDIWLAPRHEWYPVKLRFTETNGDYLDMSLSDLPATPP